MDASEVLRPAGGGTELDIMVTPNAKKAQVGEVDRWRKRLVIKVQPLPSEGRANRAVVDLLSEVFGAKVEIVRGHTDRHKTVVVPLPLEEVRARLEGE
ncbi:MAG: YggU family protein [Methanomassiliicoccus sp.]|nr:YggU family protein [Methanomassiliicoccus sp.]